MENANYPIPDPEWDYFGTWKYLQEVKSQIDALLSEMAEIEDATDSSDRMIDECLLKIYHHLQRARNFMPPNT